MATPGIVLVHGGQHGAWCWDRVVPLLERPALAVDLPGRGLRPGPVTGLTIDDFAAAIVADVEASDLGPVVLVGHSMAGLCVPEAAARLGDRVEHLVLIAADVPDEGHSGLDGLPAPLRAALRLHLTRALRRPGGAFELPRPVARHMFCSDLTPADSTALLGRLVPEAPGILMEPVSRAGLSPTLPRTFVMLDRDRAMSLRVQHRMAATLGGGCARIDSGHSVMLSQPRALAEVLNRL